MAKRRRVVYDHSDSESEESSNTKTENHKNDRAEEVNKHDNLSKEKFKLKQRLILTSVVLQGFKSYKERHEVGPFDSRFTCIVGVNGCGKSNLFDAICFVFGFQSKDIRSKNLTSLINRELMSEETSPTAEVTLNFDVVDNVTNFHVNSLSLTRSIDKRGKSQYQMTLSGHSTEKVSKENVQHTLKSFGVDINFPERFIILQHSTVRLAQRKPVEMMEELETLIGLDTLKDEVNQERKRASELKLGIHNQTQQLISKRSELSVLQPKMNEFNDYIQELNNYKVKQNGYLSRLNELNRMKYNHVKREIEVKTREKLKYSKNRCKLLNDVQQCSIHEEEKKLKLISVTNEIQTKTLGLGELLSKQDLIQTEEETYKRKNCRITKRKIQVIAELDSLRAKNEHFTTHHDALSSKLKKMKEEEFKKARVRDLSQFEEIKTLEKSIHKLSTDPKYLRLVSNHQKERVAETTKKELEDKRKELQTQLSQNQNKSDKAHADILRLKNQEVDIRSNIERLNRNIHERKGSSMYEQKKFMTIVRILQASTEGVLGNLTDLCMFDRKYDLAVSSVLQPIIVNTVIVDSSNTALKVIDYFKRNKIGVVKCEIVTSHHLEERGTCIETDCIEMSKIITSNPKVTGIINKYTKNWWISDSNDVSMNLKRQCSVDKSVRRNIVSLSGEIYHSSGEVRFRSKNSSINFFSLDTDDCTKSVDELEELKKEQSHELIRIRESISDLERNIMELVTENQRIQSKFSQCYDETNRSEGGRINDRERQFVQNQEN